MPETALDFSGVHGGLAEVDTNGVDITADVAKQYELSHTGLNLSFAGDSNTVLVTSNDTAPDASEGEGHFQLLADRRLILGPGVHSIRLDAAAGGPGVHVYPIAYMPGQA